ncbi:MAG TPA: protein-L-isoaspartate(D-aspartate) O-methyltransferase [Burkholderiales bacterium]|nr:protein-L-isoaspartate(D-aspartate) O-methyltransferase [Burkholderiales bacterium]
MPFAHLSAALRGLLLVIRGAVIASVSIVNAPAQDRYADERKALLEEIARTTRETAAETGRAAISERVMNALARVPRHRLVPPGEEAYAYRNRPLSIGLGQTISQPYIVAIMTEFLDVKPGDKVLEVGTGSGYQAAVLAELGAKVYTIEIVEPLGREAAKRLAELGYGTVATRIGDGYQGWPEQAPFDSIVVTAAPLDVLPALVEQLKPGGKLVIPLGPQAGAQTLYVMEKDRQSGKLTRRPVLAVRFVPLTGRGK